MPSKIFHVVSVWVACSLWSGSMLSVPLGAAIFFEFKHFNPRSGGIVTLCYSFMEMDEIRPGKAFLEM